MIGILLLTLLTLIIYCGFIFWFWRGLTAAASYQLPENPKTELPLSIIIAAHNEEALIGETVQRLVRQNYPREKYEIIVVADRCTDRTVPVVREAAGDFPALKIVEISELPEGIAPKKFALQRGIQQARYDYLILMDADSRAGSDYLSTVNRYFADGVEVLVNIPKMAPNSSLLYLYLLPERLTAWGIAAAAVGHGKPFLCFGTSWAYTRQVFQKAGGFAGFSQSVSGDDDLLIRRMGETGAKAAVCFVPEGWVETLPPKNWRAFLIQRRRHHSAGKYYAPRVKVGYAGYHLSNLFLWILPFLFTPAYFALFVKFTLDFFSLRYSAHLFREKIGGRQFVVFEIGYLLHNLLIAPLGFLGKIRWK